MAGHTLYGKTNVCYTEVAEFTDFQGIGRDPLYKRYDSVNAVVEKCIKKSKKDQRAENAALTVLSHGRDPFS